MLWQAWLRGSPPMSSLNSSSSRIFVFSTSLNLVGNIWWLCCVGLWKSNEKLELSMNIISEILESIEQSHTWGYNLPHKTWAQAQACQFGGLKKKTLNPSMHLTWWNFVSRLVSAFVDWFFSSNLVSTWKSIQNKKKPSSTLFSRHT